MEIRPFRVAIAQESLDDLRSRLDRIRWTSDIRAKERGLRNEPGLGPAARRVLARPLRLAGRRGPAERLPQFVTEIDGQDIHFLHVGRRRRTPCR